MLLGLGGAVAFGVKTFVSRQIAEVSASTDGSTVSISTLGFPLGLETVHCGWDDVEAIGARFEKVDIVKIASSQAPLIPVRVCGRALFVDLRSPQNLEMMEKLLNYTNSRGDMMELQKPVTVSDFSEGVERDQ